MTQETLTPESQSVQYDVSILTDDDIYLFNEGSHFRLHEKLGSHPINREGVDGTYFAVWAPDAEKIFVVGDFNDWQSRGYGRGSSPK